MRKARRALQEGDGASDTRTGAHRTETGRARDCPERLSAVPLIDEKRIAHATSPDNIKAAGTGAYGLRAGLSPHRCAMYNGRTPTARFITPISLRRPASRKGYGQTRQAIGADRRRPPTRDKAAPRSQGQDLRRGGGRIQEAPGRRGEREAAEKKKADEAAQEKQNSTRCPTQLASLQAGGRITQTNAQGERDYMSDAQMPRKRAPEEGRRACASSRRTAQRRDFGRVAVLPAGASPAWDPRRDPDRFPPDPDRATRCPATRARPRCQVAPAGRCRAASRQAGSSQGIHHRAPCSSSIPMVVCVSASA